MLKAMGEIARFSDGLRVTTGVRQLYVKDILGNEAVGSGGIDARPPRPSFVIDDVLSGDKVEYDGDCARMNLHKAIGDVFCWWPQIEEAVVLKDDFDNDFQRQGVTSHQYRGFTESELLFDVGSHMGWPIGENARKSMVHSLECAHIVYAYVVERIFAEIAENTDVLSGFGGYRSDLSNPKGMEKPFKEFLAADGRIDEYIRGLPVTRNGVPYNNMKIVLASLEAIPEDVLEQRFQNFKDELNAKERVNEIQSEYAPIIMSYAGEFKQHPSNWKLLSEIR